MDGRPGIAYDAATMTDPAAQQKSPRSATATTARRSSHLLFNAVLFVFIIGTAAVATLVYREAMVERNVYTRIMDDKIQTSARQLQTFFRPVGENLQVIRHWYRSGLIALDSPQRLADLVGPLTAADPQISAFYLQSSAGQFYQLHFSADGWRFNTSRTLPPLLEQPWIREATTGTAAAESGPDSEAPELPIWSPFLTLPETGQAGLLAALRWRAVEGPEQVVAAYGLDKQQLDAFAGELPLAEEGILVLIGRGGQLACMSRATGGVFSVLDQSALLVGEQTEHLLVAQALVERKLASRAEVGPFQFRFQGQQWWGTSFPFSGVEGGVQLALLLPTKDLAARLEKVTDGFTYVLIGLLALGVSLVAVLANRYRVRLAAGRKVRLPKVESESDLRALIAAGETDQVEFKSTLRMNLAKGKPGKEVEISWLKTVAAFLNTAGGVLIVGIADDGEVLGIAADEFSSEDRFLLHYNNLIKEHIGLQNARYIAATLRDLQSKRIFIVACRPAEKPIFVTIGQQESFYIRVGSGSRKLSSSQIIDHLEQG